MSANLGGKRQASRIALEDRIDALELAVRQIPSSFLGPPALPARILLSGHGWSVGNWLRNNAGTWALADISTDDDEQLAVVVRVVNSANVDVVHVGLTQLAFGLYDDYTDYFLDTAGEAVSTEPVDPVKRRMTHRSLEAGWIFVYPPTLGKSHNHTLDDLSDVVIDAPVDGDIPTYDAATEMWLNGPPAGLGTRLARSVIGRSANSDGSAADIQANTTGDVLQMGASTLIWDKIGSASIAAGAVLSANLGSDVVLASLHDIDLTGIIDKNFLRYDLASNKWKCYDLGPITYGAAASELAFDAGTTAISAGLGATGSRFILSGAPSPLDFLLSGSVAAGTDISARIRRVSSSRISFYDQALTSVTSGTEVLRWNCSSTATSRNIQFLVDVGFADQAAGTGRYLTVHGDATDQWTIQDTTGTPRKFLTFFGAATSYTQAQAILSLAGNKIYGDFAASSFATSIDLGAAGGPLNGAWNQHQNLAITAGAGGGSGTLTMSGLTKTTMLGAICNVGAVGGALSFFNGASHAFTSVATVAGFVIATAGATYTAVEQGAINNLTTALTAVRQSLSDLRDALHNYGLV